MTLSLAATVEKGGSRRGQRTYQTGSGEGSTRATRIMGKGTTTFRAVTYREIGGYHHPVGTSHPTLVSQNKF